MERQGEPHSPFEYGESVTGVCARGAVIGCNLFPMSKQVLTTGQRERPMTLERSIQPLREVGTLTKTQYWTFDDIEDAIREANIRGIDPQSLFGTATPGANLSI